MIDPSSAAIEPPNLGPYLETLGSAQFLAESERYVPDPLPSGDITNYMNQGDDNSALTIQE